MPYTPNLNFTPESLRLVNGVPDYVATVKELTIDCILPNPKHSRHRDRIADWAQKFAGMHEKYLNRANLKSQLIAGTHTATSPGACLAEIMNKGPVNDAVSSHYPQVLNLLSCTLKIISDLIDLGEKGKSSGYPIANADQLQNLISYFQLHFHLDWTILTYIKNHTGEMTQQHKEQLQKEEAKATKLGIKCELNAPGRKTLRVACASLGLKHEYLSVLLSNSDSSRRIKLRNQFGLPEAAPTDSAIAETSNDEAPPCKKQKSAADCPDTTPPTQVSTADIPAIKANSLPSPTTDVLDPFPQQPQPATELQCASPSPTRHLMFSSPKQPSPSTAMEALIMDSPSVLACQA